MPTRKKAHRTTPAYFESYAEYNRLLRSWFVAFGIGGLAMFLVEDRLRDALTASGEARTVVALFLIGVGLQILITGLNKYANWYCYAGEDDVAYRRTATYRFWSGIARQFIIDVVVDLATAVAFFAASVTLFGIFAR